MGGWVKKICCVLSLLLATSAFAASDDVVQHDNSRISIFLQPAISFLSFEEREYFQDAIDTIYQEFRANALTAEESLTVAKQDFQRSTFASPSQAVSNSRFCRTILLARASDLFTTTNPWC